MNAKITLYSDAHLIDKVKVYAKKHNTSVSKIVSNFFEEITKEQESPASTKLTSKLKGILKEKDIKKAEYQSYLEEKYL